MANTPATTAELPVSRTKEEVIKEAKRIEESLLYSSKAHFFAANFWNGVHLIIGLPLVALSSVAGIKAWKEADSVGSWAVAISVSIAILSAMITFLNPSDRASVHLKAGNDYDSLMNRARLFWAIQCLGEDPDSILTSQVTGLATEKAKLNQTCPQVPFLAYIMARKGIQRGQGDYTVDKPNP